MSFLIYDLVFLFLFVMFVSVFLYARRKNLKKEGFLFLYKTRWGINLINRVGNQHKKALKFLSYIVVGTGYILMTTGVYLFYTIVKVYIFRPDIVSAIKVPPIIPLIPYLPKIFKLGFLPEFNFTYWIIILAIIAISHEFAHGIFAAYNKVRIKTTGFGFFPFFLPIFLAAFVELDEKKMAKKSKFSQMSILAAGTFANLLVAGFFFGIMWLFFSLTFVPAGITFDSYSYSVFPIANVTMLNGVLLENSSYKTLLGLINTTNILDIGNQTYDDGILGFSADNEGNYYIGVYDDSPAINAELNGAITEIDGVKIDSREKLEEEIIKKSPGEKITIKTQLDEESKVYSLILGENPEKKGIPWLGIGFIEQQRTGIMSKIIGLFSSFKKPNVYYAPTFGGIGQFIYNLLWWLVLISISVALVNMLPVGIFDGGRFFYLTILAITSREKIAKKVYSLVTYLFLFVLALIMTFWAFSFF